jgi:hypothetical protein
VFVGCSQSLLQQGDSTSGKPAAPAPATDDAAAPAATDDGAGPAAAGDAAESPDSPAAGSPAAAEAAGAAAATGAVSQQLVRLSLSVADDSTGGVTAELAAV